jgi:hypothetical protein
MILSNITSTPSTAATLLSLKVPLLPDPKSSTSYYPVNSRSGTCAAPVPYPSGDPQEVLGLPLLVEAFVQGAALHDEQDPSKRLRKASLHFLSSVFANITIVSGSVIIWLNGKGLTFVPSGSQWTNVFFDPTIIRSL